MSGAVRETDGCRGTTRLVRVDATYRSVTRRKR